MIRLDKYISDLIYTHDCVVIPNFGAFITSYKETEIHHSTHSMYPPQKTISFNPLLKIDDNLLVNHIVEKTQQAKSIVEKQIEELVYEWKRLLEIKKNIVLENIGKIWLDDNFKFHFEPSTLVNYLPSSYGLESFSPEDINPNKPKAFFNSLDYKDTPTFQPQNPKVSFENNQNRPLHKHESNVHRRSPKIETPSNLGNNTSSSSQPPPRKGPQRPNERNHRIPKKNTKPYTPPKKRRRISPFFLLIILAITGIAFYELNSHGYIDKIKVKIFNYLNPPPKTPIVEKQQEPEVVEEPPPIKTVKKAPKQQGKYTTSKRFHVMAGAFSLKKNALAQLGRIKDIGFSNASYIGINHKGLHEITYGSYDNLESAEKLLEIVHMTNDEFAWLFIIPE